MFPLQKSHISSNSPIFVTDLPSVLPPPLPVKSRDLPPPESPPPDLAPSEDAARPPSPPLCRSSTARVSFREPISSSYSVEEDEEEEEENEAQEVIHEEEEGEGEEENQQEEEEAEGGFGSRLNLQKGIPPQMDLLGKSRLSDSGFMDSESQLPHSSGN